jgi:hydrogenase maturation protease
MRVLIGGIGYRHLRDYSFGVKVIETLAGRQWPAGVAVEDISYGPIAVVQRLEDDPPADRFERAVIVAAAERAGRAPGTLTVYRWDGALPGTEQIQAAVSEAVTGVIALDNTLIIGRHFAALPSEVIVAEVQPATTECGDEFSEVVARVFPFACEIVGRAATDVPFPASIAGLPLGGGAPRPVASFRPHISHVFTRTR